MSLVKTILFYKPYGVLSTFSDPSGRETLKAYIPIEGIYSAGRLDYDSEGLLVVTSDGELIHRLTDPKHHLVKTYLAQVEGEFDQEKINQIQAGIQLKDFRTLPCRVLAVPAPELSERRKPITPHDAVFWLRIQLHEGKKHQIRHMTAAVGYPCLRLVRVAIGALGIGELVPGEWRELTRAEVENLKKG